MALIGIQLDRLIGVEIHRREVNGEMCDCLSIPIPWNGISCFKGKHYYINFTMTRMDPNPEGRTHYLSMYYPPQLERWHEKIKELGLWKKRLSYVGTVKGRCFEEKKPKSNLRPNSINKIADALNKD